MFISCSLRELHWSPILSATLKCYEYVKQIYLVSGLCTIKSEAIISNIVAFDAIYMGNLYL